MPPKVYQGKNDAFYRQTVSVASRGLHISV